MKIINVMVEDAVAWISIFKTAACFLGGGAIMGFLRGSATSGVLAGLILFGMFLAIALAVIAIDYRGRNSGKSALPRVPEREREAA